MAYLFGKRLRTGEFVLYNKILRDFKIIDKSYNIHNLEELFESPVYYDLLNERFILPSYLNEHEVNRYFNNKIKYDLQKLYITDVFSFDCNLKCLYCMQQNRNKKQDIMSPTERVNLWKRIYEIFWPREVVITLFGGEPFLYPKYLNNLLTKATDALLPISRITAVTNGTMINELVIDVINKFNISDIQITIDGPSVIHDKRRITKNGKGSWALIVNNIKKLLNDTKTRIIINTVIDLSNYKYYGSMIDELVEEFDHLLFDDKNRIVFNIGTICRPEGGCEFVDANIPNGYLCKDIYYNVLNEAVDKGIKVVNFLNNSFCVNRKENEFVIHPTGDIYKCISGVGIDDFKLCSYNEVIEEPELVLINSARFVESNKDFECNNCDFYGGICNGGCNFNSYTLGKTKECDKISMAKEIDRLLDVLGKVKWIDVDLFIKRE
jgi:uncharacterized protein